jgi:excinuclease UvrABC nuclease subunit
MRDIELQNRRIKIDCSEDYYVMLDNLNKHQRRIPKDQIQNKPGIYIFWGWDDKPIRIGKSQKLRNRLIQYDTNLIYNAVSNWLKNDDFFNAIQYVSVIYIEHPERLELELIRFHKPQFNFNKN